MALISKAAEAIAQGDIVSRAIRSSNAWSLLPTQALYSTVLPGHYMRGPFIGQINFPAWLGKFSSRGRVQRQLQQLATHVRLSTGGVEPRELAMGSARALLNHVTGPLLRRGVDGVEATIEAMRCYDLVREDLDILADCSLWPSQRDPMSQVESKVHADIYYVYIPVIISFIYFILTHEK